MRHLIRSSTIATSLFLAALTPAVAQQSAPPPAPAPGTPGTYVLGGELAGQLKASIAQPADPAVAEIAANNQYQIHEVHRGKSGPPAIHHGWTEMHFILEGSGTLVTGGKIVSSPTGNIIEGGVSHEVKKGDAIVIPSETPHWYSKVDGNVKYLEVRFVAPTEPK
jgi:mannose-6-phosphate isomerase-like protein (cupin superfamily)